MALSDLLKDEKGMTLIECVKGLCVVAVVGLVLYAGSKALNYWFNIPKVEERNRGFGSDKKERFVVIGGRYYYDMINEQSIEEAFSEKGKAVEEQKRRPGYESPKKLR